MISRSRPLWGVSDWLVWVTFCGAERGVAEMSPVFQVRPGPFRPVICPLHQNPIGCHSDPASTLSQHQPRCDCDARPNEKVQTVVAGCGKTKIWTGLDRATGLERFEDGKRGRNHNDGRIRDSFKRRKGISLDCDLAIK
ncbi:hypothetical protein QBC35DRAFT_13531 [Podospora australis]|uniref:Uncharacterized protein n=1 Tax=Podospora australis TaxID=1536484 RepID=A0AAN6X061_9PEZI|nr:hypothetical protein QBC35DRAFT_13531 [Podospora australis]